MKLNLLKSSAEGSPANPSQLLDTAEHKPTNDGFGLNSLTPFAFYDHNSQSWKTYQACLMPTTEGQWAKFLGTWPRSGSMRSGKSSRQRPLISNRFESGCGLWPALVKGDVGTRQSSENWDGTDLVCTMVALWRKLGLLGTKELLPLNPSFAEIHMGLPLGWTELEPAETPSSPKSLNGSDDG